LYDKIISFQMKVDLWLSKLIEWRHVSNFGCSPWREQQWHRLEQKLTLRD
jgi:hypothetical protein